MRAPLLPVALLLAVSSVARADSTPASGAAELLDAQGTALMQAHRYAEACPKLAESARIGPGTGVLLRLALCYEQSGKTASAWSAYREAAGRARNTGDRSLSDLAERHEAELSARLPKLVVRLSSSSSAVEDGGLALTLDDAPFASSAIGAEVPIDPGAHTVRLVAPGRPPISRSFDVPAGRGTTDVQLDLPAASREPAPSNHPGLRTAAYVSGGVGLAGLAVGSALGLVALSNWNQAHSECAHGTSGCSQDALDRQSSIHDEATASTVAFVVGGVGVAAAALLFGFSWAPSSRGVAGVAPAADPHGARLYLTGSF